MLKQLKKLQFDLLNQVGITFIILIPFIFIASIGYRNRSTEIIDSNILRTELRVMLVFTAALIFIIIRSFRLAKKRAQIIAQEMTESFKKSEERYKAFIANSTEGIWLFELEKAMNIKDSVNEQLEHCYKYAYLAECNNVYAHMYGFKKPEEIIGTKLTDFFIPTDPKNIEYLSAFIKSGYKLINTESKERDKNGNIHYFSNSFVGVVENGYVKRAWGTQRDITKEKEIEFMKDNFILNASHELRTPIAGIKGLVSMILQGNFGKIQQPLIKPVKMIESSVDKLNRLTQDILDVTKIDSHKLKLSVSKVNLNQIIADVIRDLKTIATVKSVTLKVINKKEYMIEIDPEKLKNILYNLIENAIKFTPKGTVTIDILDTESTITIHIKDTGIGIAKEDQDKIFNRFTQITSQSSGKPEGTGLGLYIARELAKLMHGNIHLVKSNLHKGCTFELTLPKSVK